MGFVLDPQVAEALAPISYALRLSQAGVPVEFHLHPGVPHEFESIAHTSDAAGRVMADRVRVLAAL